MHNRNISANTWIGLCSILFASVFLIMCNTVEPIKVGSINLKLGDSLTVEAGRYDTLKIDILDSAGKIRIQNAFYGEYSNANGGEIKGIPLGENPPANYRIQILAFKEKKLVAIYQITVTGGEASRMESMPLPVVNLSSLAFDPATFSLTVGETSLAIIPKATPNTASNNVTLSLSDPTKATVLPGNLIRADAEGTVLVTATSIFDPKIEAKLTLTIAPAIGKPLPKSILISKRSLTLVPGGTAQALVADVKPDDADPRVIWSSGNSGIASVIDGMVSPVKVGKTWIKVQALGAATVCDSIPVEVLVPEPFDSVRISRAKTRFFVNGAGQKIDFATYPTGSRAVLNWTSQDEGIIRIDADGSVTARSAGSAWIKAVGNGFPDVFDSLRVTVVKDAPKLNAGPTQSVDPGKKATFNVAVEQEFGGIKSLKWDLDGDGVFEGSATSVPAIAEMTYPTEKKEYLAAFKVEDGEGNTDSISVRVRVGFNTPLIIITSPSRDTLVKSPAFKVVYTVDGAPKTMDFTLAGQGRNRLVIIETKASGTDSAIVYVTLDSKPPVVKILSPIPGLVTNKSIIQVDWTVDSVTQIQKTEEDISAKEGEITILRETVDEAGNPGSSNVIIVRDVTKPKIAIISPKNGDTVSANPVAVQWSVDGDVQTSQLTEILSASDGEKSIMRKASDAAGNTDSLTIKVVLDASKPGAPTVTVDLVSPSKINIPTWSWTASGTGTGDFQYKLNSGDFSTGATTTRLLTFKPTNALPDGVHTLFVREKDAQGAWGLTGSSVVEVDTKPAVINITAPLSGAKISSSPVTVTWTVDGGAPQTNTETLTGLDGERTITRTGVDKAGNSGSGNVKVILDLAKPATPIFTTPVTAVSTTRSRKPAWIWKSGGGDASGGFRYQLGTAAAVEVTGTTFTPSTDLVDGTYILKVAEKDAQGNWSVDAISTVTVKGSAPTAPMVNVNADFSNAPKWSWTGTTGATFGYKLSGASSYISEGTATSYQPTVAQMGEGSKIVCVAEKDVIGYGPEACKSITVDRTAPTIEITSDVSPELMVTSVNPAFSGTVSDVNLDRVECKVGTGAAVNATLSAGTWSCAPGMGDGDFTVTFTAFDKAQNSASTAAVTVHKRSKVVFVRKGKTGDGTSWANAKGDISDVLNPGVMLSANTEVWVSAGTYLIKGEGDPFKFSSNTSLVGGFSSAGAPFNRSDATQSNPVHMDPADLFIGTETEPINNLTIFGITFNAQISNSGVPRVYIDYSKGIVIEKCSFINFMSDVPLLIRSGSTVTLKSTTFNKNFTGSYGAIMVGWGAVAELIGCTITGNINTSGSFAGGITVGGESSATLTNCTVSGNKITTLDWVTGAEIQVPMNINVWSSGQLFHSGLILPEGKSTVSGDGIISPAIP